MLPAIMMEVGGTTSNMMKEELPKLTRIRVIVSGNFYLCDNRYESVYFMMRRKLLHRIEGDVRSYQSYDDGGGRSC